MHNSLSSVVKGMLGAICWQNVGNFVLSYLIHRVGIMYAISPLIAVVAQSKAWVCIRLFVGIADSNTAGGMVVCCECCVL